MKKKVRYRNETTFYTIMKVVFGNLLYRQIHPPNVLNINALRDIRPDLSGRYRKPKPLSKLDIFFKKNEEVVWSVHLSTYLLKFGESGPSVFLGF